MHILEAIFLCIILIISANILSHYIDFLPTALIEIGLGLTVTTLFHINVELETDWFMLLFVAPLLYNDAKRFPKKELWELRAPIFANAIWLVLLTTIVGGFAIHYIVKEIPLVLAMALAAVLSPTDPVAVQGIAKQTQLPKRLLHLVSGESLINDASGLIAFKYALAAFLTGYFSIFQATWDFLYMAIVGILLGYLFNQLFYYLQLFLIQQKISDVVLHTSIQLVTPFLIYMVADEFLHASGVIAVVTAGILSIRQTLAFPGKAEIRLVTKRTWDILIYLLDGAVFIILGAELPIVMRGSLEDPTIHNSTLLLYIILIWIILFFIRSLWTYMYLARNYWRNPKQTEKPTIYSSLLSGLTGVRGAVTMATVLSLPYVFPNGDVFTQRSLVIFLACGVIMMSLLVATFVLPLFTKKRVKSILSPTAEEFEEQSLPKGLPNHMNEQEAQIYILNQALDSLLAEESFEDREIVENILKAFHIRLNILTKSPQIKELPASKDYRKVERHIYTIALQAEKDCLTQLYEQNKITEKELKQQHKLLQLKKQSINSNTTHFFQSMQLRWKKRYVKLSIFIMNSAPISDEKNMNLMKLEEERAKAAIRALRIYKKTTSEYSLEQHITSQLLADYHNHMERTHFIEKHTQHQQVQQNLKRYYLKAIDAERTSIQELVETDRISLEVANRLRQTINYMESELLMERG